MVELIPYAVQDDSIAFFKAWHQSVKTFPMFGTEAGTKRWLEHEQTLGALDGFLLTHHGQTLGLAFVHTRGMPPFNHHRPTLFGLYLTPEASAYQSTFLEKLSNHYRTLKYPELFWKRFDRLDEERDDLSLWVPVYPVYYSDKKPPYLFCQQFVEHAPILLEGERIYFRCLHQEDLALMLPVQQNVQVMRYLDGVRDESNVRQRMIEWRGHHLRNGFAIWSVFEKTTNRFMGCAGLFYLRMDESQKEVEMAYTLDSAFWGHGLGTEIVHTLVEFGFNTRNFERIWAITRPNNLGSQKVLHKNRFERTHQAPHQGSLAFFHCVDKHGRPLPNTI